MRRPARRRESPLASSQDSVSTQGGTRQQRSAARTTGRIARPVRALAPGARSPGPIIVSSGAYLPPDRSGRQQNRTELRTPSGSGAGDGQSCPVPSPRVLAADNDPATLEGGPQ